MCKKCAKVCRAPENGKSHEESCDSSWDFGALEGTRIPGPLIKSQMLYQLSYERIFSDLQILPNYITTPAPKKARGKRQKSAFPQHTDPAGRAPVPFIKASFAVTSLGRGYSGGNFLFTNGARTSTIKAERTVPARIRRGFLIGGWFYHEKSLVGLSFIFPGWQRQRWP